VATPKIEKIWLNEMPVSGVELRLDWDNDRHHAVVVSYPFGAKQVADAMVSAAQLINRDRNLADGS